MYSILQKEYILKGFLISVFLYILSSLPFDLFSRLSNNEGDLVKQYLNVRDYRGNITYAYTDRGVKNYYNKLMLNGIIYEKELNHDVLEHYKMELSKNDWNPLDIPKDAKYLYYKKGLVNLKVYEKYAGYVVFVYEIPIYEVKYQ